MDPYHKWFGIAPFEQPANHYRLLGIRNFESDKDVIDSAAEQRMTYLHTVDEGEDVPVAQRLLNEVSNARLTLLSDEKKRAYDEGLKHGLETAPVAKHSGGPVSDVAISPVRPASRSEGSSGNRRTNKSGWPAPALVSIAALTAAIVGLAGLLLFRGNTPSSNRSSKPPSVVITNQKQKGIPDSQHDVAPLEQGAKTTDRSKENGGSTARSTKKAQAPEPSSVTEESPPKNETIAEFPIGGLIDTPSEARVTWQRMNDHVAAEPEGDLWRCRFRLSGFEDVREVFLVGSFTEWEKKPEPMQRNDGTWETIVSLKPEDHEYKFIVDSKWQPDGQDNYLLKLDAPDVPHNRQPEDTTSSRKQSREDALVILDTAGLHESETGVWSLKKSTNFSQREYELIKKDRNVMRALKTAGGRLQGQQ